MQGKTDKGDVKPEENIVRKTVRITKAVYTQIEKVSGSNFNRWVCFLIDRELKKDRGESSGAETQSQVVGEKLDNVLDQQLLNVMNDKAKGGKNLLSDLTDLEIAKLAVQRAPKNTAENVDEAKVSLREAMKRMPDVEDIRKELIKAKGEVSRLKIEAEIHAAANRQLRQLYGALDAGVAGDEIFRGIRELCNDIAVKSYNLREEDDLRDMVSTGIRVLQLVVKNGIVSEEKNRS